MFREVLESNNKEQRYEVRVPFKKENGDTTGNYVIVNKCLNGLMKNLW